MNRWLVITWVVVVVAATFGLYRVKYEVQTLRQENATLMRELQAEKEALHVIAAEWAYLNRPERLQRLAQKHLGAEEMTVDLVAEVEVVPFQSVSPHYVSANSQDRVESAQPMEGVE